MKAPEVKDFIDVGQEVLITNDALAYELYHKFLVNDERFPEGHFKVYKDTVVRLTNAENQEQSFRYVFTTRWGLRCFEFLEDNINDVAGLEINFWSYYTTNSY